jgi:hypothetical protein
MTRLRRLTGLILIVCGFLSWAPTARADAVVYWNDIASQVIGPATVAGRAGPATTLDFAMVHAAVYDAVQAIDKRYKPYHVVIPDASGSPAAAAAKAAHDVLVHLFPAQTAFLDQKYLEYLNSQDLKEDDPGVAVGQKAAAGIIALRANDGSFSVPAPPPFTGGTDPGLWRPTPELCADGGAVVGYCPPLHPQLPGTISRLAPTRFRQPPVRQAL